MSRFWNNYWLLGRVFVDFWPLVRFLAFEKFFGFLAILGFLDDFCHLSRFLAFGLMSGFWVNSWLLGRFFVDFWPLD